MTLQRAARRRFPLIAPGVLAVLLGACVEAPSYRDERSTLPPEKAVIRALALVEASEAQRRTVLAAWDELHPELARLNRELQTLEAAQQALSPREAGYLLAVDALIARAAPLLAERERVQARFQQKLATALDEKQWRRWDEAAQEVRNEYGHADADGSGDGGGRRPR